MSETNSGRPSRIFGQYIIKYSFQFRFALAVLTVIAASCLVLYLEVNMAIERILTSGMIGSDDVIAQLNLITGIVGKTALLIIVVDFGIALVCSHYIAGPIYRFERTFQEISEGNLGMVVRLRPKDEFQDTAVQFNQALSGLRNKLQKDRDDVLNSLSTIEKDLIAAGRPAEAKLLKQAIDRIQTSSAVKFSLPK